MSLVDLMGMKVLSHSAMPADAVLMVRNGEVLHRFIWTANALADQERELAAARANLAQAVEDLGAEQAATHQLHEELVEEREVLAITREKVTRLEAQLAASEAGREVAHATIARQVLDAARCAPHREDARAAVSDCAKTRPGLPAAWCHLPEGHAGGCEYVVSTTVGPYRAPKEPSRE